MEKENKSSTQIEKECLVEIEKVLQKHKCELQVNFAKDIVLGVPVLKYQPMVVYKKDS